MPLDLARLQADFPDLIPLPLQRDAGITAYRLQLPTFMPGRAFEWAELRLPRGFPDQAFARIVLSPDTILAIPHVEVDGALCLDGDPGPGSGLSANDRVLCLLNAYQEEFLEPWQLGKLDSDFAKEALNYWAIYLSREQSPNDAVTQVWTVDGVPGAARVCDGVHVLPSRIVIAADDSSPLTDKLIHSLGLKAQQQRRVLIADIPITRPLTPTSWPRSLRDLNQLLESHLAPQDLERFQRPRHRRGKSSHLLVLLRHLSYGFAYLLPGGPPTRVESGGHYKTYPARSSPLPLVVKRLDPAWTMGRDQVLEVSNRQARHVLVLGGGALGSPVVEHLAKAGVGHITLVDDGVMDSENLGRHLLGATALGVKKAEAVAMQVNLAHPSSRVTPYVVKAERWLQQNSLQSVDLVLDLTGEFDVRWAVEVARQHHSCPCLIGWMEPFVTAAHACCLPASVPWRTGNTDSLLALQAVEWPDDVTQQVPGCSSRFQSYTAAAATYAVALAVEHALGLLDRADSPARVVSWVRGQRYLDTHRPGLTLRAWAAVATHHDGMLIERPL